MTRQRASTESAGERLVARIERVGRLRLAEVDLGAPHVTPNGAAPPGELLTPDLMGHAELGGAALALASFCAAERRGAARPEPALTVAVGGAVARSVPTAARVSIAGRAPLRPGVTEAQCGGSFAFGFVRALDGLVLTGCAPDPVHLVVRGDGVWARCGAALCASVDERSHQALAGEVGRAALVAGPAADAGLPFSNLASCAEGVPTSFVGRGGMGLVMRRAGVLSISVEAADDGALEAREGDERLVRAMRSSPRLAERGRGGTLELGAHRGADETAGPWGGGVLGRHGCRGCPTPCGVTLVDGPGVVGRFAALQGFGGNVAALERCNDLGMDARSAASLVRKLGLVGELPAVLDGLVVAGGALHAEALHLERAREREPGPTAHAGDLAALVGSIASPRGPEPMRSLSVFGISGALGAAGLRASGDAHRDAGRLARWHGALSSAVDASGFCSFSAAALLADGVLELDALAEALAPEGGWDGAGERGGRAMIQAGERHLELHVALGGGAERAVPAGLEEAVAEHDRALSWDGGALIAVRGGSRPDQGGGVVKVLASGVLARALGGDRGPLEVEVQAAGRSAAELVGLLAELHPAAASKLLSPDGTPVPAMLRGQHVLAATDTVVAGDRVELLLLIAGG